MTVPILVAAAVILSAPFIGQIRSTLRSAFPGRFVAIVGSAVTLAIVAAVAVAVARIRARRRARYGATAGAIALGAAYVLAFSTGMPEVDVVEPRTARGRRTPRRRRSPPLCQRPSRSQFSCGRSVASGSPCSLSPRRSRPPVSSPSALRAAALHVDHRPADKWLLGSARRA